MRGFGSDNQLWTETRTYIAAMASAACMTTGEKARLSALYDTMGTSQVLHAHDTHYIVAKMRKALSVWPGSSD